MRHTRRRGQGGWRNRPVDGNDRLDGLMLVCNDGRFENHVDDFCSHLAHTLSRIADRSEHARWGIRQIAR
jgi:hypothetical protein